MKLYAVVEPQNGSVRILSICTNKERAEEIVQNKEMLGIDAQVEVYEDGCAEQTAFCFNASGEFEGYISGDIEMQGIHYRNGKPDSIVVLADTEEEAQEKALNLLAASYGISEITQEDYEKIIEIRRPEGCFWMQCDGYYIGLDNSTGNAWTEEFERFSDCLAWLSGEKNDYEIVKSTRSDKIGGLTNNE